VQILGWEKSDVAMHVIMESIERYDRTFLQHGP
jgi:hypothetical protein